MALTRITGSKWLVKDNIDGAKTTNAAGEGQIAEATVNTYNMVDNAITNDKIDNTGDFTFNKVTSTTTIDGTDITASGELKGTTAAVGTNGTEFTVDASGNVVIAGDLTVNGENVIVNTTTLDVEDKNVTVAKGGTAATANGAGLTVEITDGTNGSIVYDSTSATKFAVGEVGAEDDIVGATAAQELTNKDIMTVDGVINVDGTDYDEVENALRALAAVAGSTSQTLYTDASALVGNDLTVAGATGINAVYASGIRLSEGAANDYTVAGNVITFAEAPLGNIVVDYK